MLDVNMLMFQNVLRIFETNTMGFEVENLKVFLSFVLINTEIEVFLGQDLIINSSFQLLSFLFLQLILEILIIKLLLEEFVNLVFDFFDIRVITFLNSCELCKEISSCLSIIQDVFVALFFCQLFFILS